VIYLDHNATTPIRPEAAAAVAAALALCGNPSSVHAAGRAARRVLETARAQVAALVAAAPADLVFTSGGTEANNLALRSWNGPVVVSAIEHDSVRVAVPHAILAPVTGEGVVDPDGLAALLPEKALVSVMLANNETGVVQPVAAIAERVHAKGGVLHVDAVQAAAKIALDMRALGADLMTLSAHKLGGPMGVGALVGRADAGTENLPGIAGFGAAAAAPHDFARLAPLRDRLEAALAGEAVFFGQRAPRLPTTSCLALPGVPAETQVIAAVSAGAACSSGKVRPSHVLGAMGVAPDLAGSAIRVSLGWTTTEADIDAFLAAWRQMRTRSLARRSAA
jgi:cysteine desulfurase